MSRERDDIQARLAALADGTLPAHEGERILALAQGSPALKDRLETQRRAVAMVGRLDRVEAPASLRRSVEALATGRPAGDRGAGRLRLGGTRLRLGAAVALAAIAVVALIAALTTGSPPGAPTVLQASGLALSPATLPSPAESPRDRGLLVSSVEGVSYPYWQAKFGWRAAGARTDRLGGRTITTVFYTDSASRRIGYSIVAGRALALPGGEVVRHRGGRYHVLRTTAGVTIVTWRRAGHTCILAARGVDGTTLMHLATWE